MHIYNDESGDLGWVLDKPFGSGGSSKYFLNCYLVVPKSKKGTPKRRVQELYKAYNISKSVEIKGSDLNDTKRKGFCEAVVEMLEREPDIKIGAIILEKKNVPELVRLDSQDILHNHMIHMGVTKHIITKEEVRLVPDMKPVQTERKKSLSDSLKSRAWFDNKSYVKLQYVPSESHKMYNLIFIDWIVNTIWRHFEKTDSESFKILEPYIEIEHLTF